MDTATLRALATTLGKITVSGRENMAMLLGCMNVVEAELKKQEGQEAKDDTNSKAE